ncbi:MAG: Trk system potassium transporter TrkA [Trueperaceae bacterium]|nr:Trk system potassium transporter TrkA [Trueperaceae bacterium]
MNVLIVGGGEIGTQITEALHRTHNVTVMDNDPEREKSLEIFDIHFIRGNGADPEDLRNAGAAKTDAFIAVTTNDDINVLACLAAKGLGAKETMAFVTRQRYMDAFSEQGAMQSIGLVIDRVLWPQRTLANQIVDIVRVPRALDSTFFANRRIKLVEYKLEEGDPFVGKPLAEINLPKSILVAGSIRGDSFVIPSGKTVLCPDDKVVFIGTTQSIRNLEAQFAPKKRVQNVVIIGGGNVGFMVAEQLQHDRVNLTVIEQKEERCNKLAEILPRALILQGDGSDLELLEQERIEDADVLVTVTDDDGKNLLVSLLAKNLGIPKIITRVGRTRNRTLFERVGIDISLTPRAAAVQEVLNWLHLDEVDHLASIENRAEVMEVIYPYQCETGMLQNLGAPPNSLIGAILRKDKVLIPHGDTTIQHGDHLYIVTTPDNVSAVENWLSRQKTAA